MSEKWKVWKTITLGTSFTSGEEFIREFERKGIRYSWWDKILLQPAFRVFHREIKIDLVRVKARQIVSEPYALWQLFKAAKGKGLRLCPVEVGPQLRLQYTEQPHGDYLLVAMWQLVDSIGQTGVFYLTGDPDGLGFWHRGERRLDFVWTYLDYDFVFVLPRLTEDRMSQIKKLVCQWQDEWPTHGYGSQDVADVICRLIALELTPGERQVYEKRLQQVSDDIGVSVDELMECYKAEA